MFRKGKYSKHRHANRSGIARSNKKDDINDVSIEQNHNKSNLKTKRKISKKVLVMLLIIIALLVALLLFKSCSSSRIPYVETLEKAFQDIYNNREVKEGKMDKDNVDEINMGVESDSSAKYVTNTINVNPIFATGSSLGNVLIENVKENNSLLQVEIYKNSDDEIMYKSPMLKPNQYIKNDTLIKSFPKGVYDATAYFKRYDIYSHKYQGNCGFRIKVSILN